MVEVSNQVLDFAQQCFVALIRDLLDNPSNFLMHPWRTVEPREQLQRLRSLANDLGLDYEALVRQGKGCDRERLEAIENGSLKPIPRLRCASVHVPVNADILI